VQPKKGTKTKMEISIINGATYKTTQVQVLGNTYTIAEVTGKYNYVNVRKETNNPFKTLGKEFKNWDVACRAYKSPEMKTALLMAEINFQTL